MAVMPLVAQEPWALANKEAQFNNDLYKMFYDNALAKEKLRLQSELGIANNMQQQDWQAGQNELQRGLARELEAGRADLTREGWDRRDAAKLPAGADALAQYREQFRQIEKEYNLPEGSLDAFAEIESGSGRNLRAKTSSARGPFQFTKATAQRFGLTDPMDPIASAIATAQYMKQNRELFVKQFGREPTGEDLYLMHQQGEGGGPKLLAQPGARAVDVVGLQAVLNNGGNINMSAAEFANMIRGKYTNANKLWAGRRTSSTQPTQTADAAPPATTTEQPGQQQQPAVAAPAPAAAPPAATGGYKIETTIGPDGKRLFKRVPVNG